MSDVSREDGRERPGGVCLIIPPSPFLLDERVFMSLGILKVAAALERAGVRVEVLDLSGVSNYLDAVRDHVGHALLRYDYDAKRLYGITATSPQLPAAVAIAEVIRGLDTLVPRSLSRIILGGPHATLVNAAWKRESKFRDSGRRAKRAMDQLTEHFDVIVAGDGELAVMDALAAPRGTILDADDRRSPYWMGDARQDEAPFPARHLVDVGTYKYQIDGVPALSLIAQLGCPFGCGFCAGRSSPMLRHIRTRSTASIVAEINSMFVRYGTRGFMFYDDELNVNPGFVDLLHGIEWLQGSLETEFRLRGFIKAELFTDEQADAMYYAGFRWILVGFESGSERILANINKKATQADNTRCIEIARRHGLKVKALMSLGHPGESTGTIAETYRWLVKVRPDDFDVTIITPYPGSPYYDEATAVTADTYVYTCKNGDRLNGDRLYQRDVDYTSTADYYKGSPDDGYVAHVSTDYLTSSALVARRDWLERELRAELGIPFNPAAPAMLYEHSMGQTALPRNILRSTEATA